MLSYPEKGLIARSVIAPANSAFMIAMGLLLPFHSWRFRSLKKLASLPVKTFHTPTQAHLKPTAYRRIPLSNYLFVSAYQT